MAHRHRAARNPVCAWRQGVQSRHCGRASDTNPGYGRQVHPAARTGPDSNHDERAARQPDQHGHPRACRPERDGHPAQPYRGGRTCWCCSGSSSLAARFSARHRHSPDKCRCSRNTCSRTTSPDVRRYASRESNSELENRHCRDHGDGGAGVAHGTHPAEHGHNPDAEPGQHDYHNPDAEPGQHDYHNPDAEPGQHGYANPDAKSGQHGYANPDAESGQHGYANPNAEPGQHGYHNPNAEPGQHGYVHADPLRHGYGCADFSAGSHYVAGNGNRTSRLFQ